MAKSLLDLGSIPNIDNMFQEIDDITAEELLEVANEAWDLENMSSLTFTPTPA